MKERGKGFLNLCAGTMVGRGLLAWFGITVLLCIVCWPYRAVPIWWDSAGYVYPHAKQIYDAGLFPILRDFDVGHPTLFYFLMALMMKLLGSAVLAGHILTWTLAALGCVSLYALCRSMALPRALSITTSILFLTFPITWANVHEILLDLPLTVFALAAFACWARRFWFGYFVFGSAALLTKIYGFTILAGPFAALLLTSGRPRDFVRSKVFWRECLYTLSPAISLVVFLVARYLVRGPGMTLGFDHPDELIPLWHVNDMLRRAAFINSEIYQPSGLGIAVMVTLGLGMVLGLKILTQEILGRKLTRVSFMDLRVLLPVVAWSIFSQLVLLQVKEHHCARYALLILPAVVLLAVYTAWRIFPRQTGWVLLSASVITVQIVLWHPLNAVYLPSPCGQWFCAQTPEYGWLWEKDLQFLDATEATQWAAQEINRDKEEHPGRSGLATGWPVDGALRIKESGYTEKPFTVQTMYDWELVDATRTRYVLELPPIFTLRGSSDQERFERQELARRKNGSVEAVVWLLTPVDSAKAPLDAQGATGLVSSAEEQPSSPNSEL